MPSWTIITFVTLCTLLFCAEFANAEGDPLRVFDEQTANVTYLRCAFSAASYLQILNETGGVAPRFTFNKLRTTFLVPPPTAAESERIGHNDCGLEWIDDAALYSGIDSLIFVGDSTIMRDFMFVKRASDEEYTQKVQKLDEDFVNATLRLSSGRLLPLHFVRLLHVRDSTPMIDAAFALATRGSMLVFTFGPHDTSWLVFRRPMPGFKKAMVGNWKAARQWWDRHAAVVMHRIAVNLHAFDLTHRRPFDDDPKIPVRPFVVIREQYLPNCKHPKYSKYPLITKCADLLHPIVVPYYRGYLRALLGTVNVPTVGIDYLFPTCVLIDAGHLARWCKRFELQLLVHALRMARRANVWQGFRDSSSAQPQSLFKLLGSAPWDHVAHHLLRHPTGPLAASPADREAMLRDAYTVALFRKWDVAGNVELDLGAEGANETQQRYQRAPRTIVSNFSLLLGTSHLLNDGGQSQKNILQAAESSDFAEKNAPYATSANGALPTKDTVMYILTWVLIAVGLGIYIFHVK